MPRTWWCPLIHSSAARIDALVRPDIDPTLEYLQPVDATTLASALGMTEQGLWGLVHTVHKQYHCVDIPKKSGGTRRLHLPTPGLAWTQTRILDAFLNRVHYPEHVTAYVRGRSTLDAAQKHAGHPILIVVDLKDFFLSTPRLWVRTAIETELKQTHRVASLLATLTTAPTEPGVRGRFIVPQGAATSGAVANLVAMGRLDPQMLEIAARHDLVYSRYADDLAFSVKTEIGHAATGELVREILQGVRASGYLPNYDKVRVQRTNTQQRLLGLCVNAHPNLPCRTYRTVRALAHSVRVRGADYTAARYGYASAEALEAYLRGMAAYTHHVAPGKVRGVVP